MQGQFLIKIYQAFSQSLQQRIKNNDYSCLFNQSEILDELKPIIQELMNQKIALGLKNTLVELNISALQKHVQNYAIDSKFAFEQAQVLFNIPKDLVYESHEPFYRCIFELMNVLDIVNIIKAILLEKTLIFVG